MDLCVAGRDSIGVDFLGLPVLAVPTYLPNYLPTYLPTTYHLLQGHPVAIDRVTTCASSYRKAGGGRGRGLPTHRVWGEKKRRNEEVC